MPFCDVTELFDYWRDYPPMHWLMRGFVGFKPPPRKPEGGELWRPPGIKLRRAPEKDREIFEMLRKVNG